MTKEQLEAEYGTDFIDEVFSYLDDLRESGETNMFGAGAYVEDEFDMKRRTARTFVSAWMQSFGS